MKSAGSDIISTIDEALGCGYCGGPLAGRPSDYFCSSRCQARWSATRAEPLVDYVEPDEQPAHVSNLVELHSPETCIACVGGRHRREAIASAVAAALTHGSSYVVTDEVAGFIGPSHNARRVFLNARVGVTPDGGVIGRQSDGCLAAVDHAAIRPRTEHLEATLRQMGRAAELAEDWIERFAGVQLADWQRDVLRGQYERWELIGRRYREQLTRTMAALAPVVEQMGRAPADAAAALQPFAEFLAPPKPPVDPRGRALWLRQNRNTGPAASARAPRTINPRRPR